MLENRVIEIQLKTQLIEQNFLQTFSLFNGLYYLKFSFIDFLFICLRFFLQYQITVHQSNAKLNKEIRWAVGKIFGMSAMKGG